MQFATFEKFEYLVRGQRKIFVHCEDYLPIGGLHGETHSHSMLPQKVDSLHDIVCSLCVIGHDRLSGLLPNAYFHPRIDSGLIKLGLRLSALLFIRRE